MTAQYTQTAQLSPSKLAANAFSSNTQNYSNQKDDVFTSVLDKAAKPYADKSDNKVANNKDNKDYAQKTKDTETPKRQEVKDKTDNTPNENQIKDKTPEKEQNKPVTNDPDSKKDSQIKDKPADKPKEPEKTENASPDEAQALKQAQEQAQKEAAAAQDAPRQTTDNQAASEETEAFVVADSAKKNVNNAVNEQILANIEHADPETLIAKAQSLADVDIDIEALKKIVEQTKTSQPVQQTPAVQTAPVQQQVLETPVENNKTQADKPLGTPVETSTEPEIDVKVSTNMPETQEQATTANIKTAKENLQSDISRLTANVEQAVDEQQTQTTVKPVTPSDTEASKTPVIKVTEEAAAQVNAKETAAAGVENKDTTSKAKSKAVEQMTKLQDTDTVVTESKTDSNNSNTNTGKEGSNTGSNLSNNAGELAAKLSVDQSPVATQQGAEAFVNKLDAQLNAKGASSFARTTTLNQTDILSQVNAKFDELQKTGNNKVSIILQPENLGKVSIEIMNSKDGIVAKMTTDSQQVKELFDKNVEALKSNLSSQGVNVNNIKVECTQESANHGMANQQNLEQQQFNQSNGQQNGQNQAHNTNQNAHGAYGAEYGTQQEEADNEINTASEIKNTDTIIKHNGKVDYTV